MSEDGYFSDTYSASRIKFRELLALVRERWPGADFQSVVTCPREKELTTDIICSEPWVEKRHLLLITTGQHGIEGYAGAAFLQLAVNEYLSKLNPQLTGVILVHAINPWGMANRRRVDQDNIDLNRNFVIDWPGFDRDVNIDYPRLRFLLEPGKLGKAEGAKFYPSVARAIALAGIGGIKRAVTLGQYRFQQGLYYGGADYQPVSKFLIEFYRRLLAEYKHVVHLDIHTGYGPANRMTIVNSPLDLRDTSRLKEQTGYDLIVKADPKEFYTIQGDMVDYLCWLGRQFNGTDLYSTCLEFGTTGDSTAAMMGSMRALIDENRLWHYGGAAPAQEEAVRRQFNEAFYPNCSLWRKRVAEDARRALTGILGNEGLMEQG